MPTIVDSFVVTLGLDASSFKRGSAEVEGRFKATRSEAAKTATELEARGKQAAEFFDQVRNSALSLLGVFLGGRGLTEFVRSATASLAELGREARNIGVAVPELSAVAMAVERIGGSPEAAISSFRRLTDEMEHFRVFGTSSIIGYLNAVGAQRTDTALQVYQKFVQYAEQHKGDIPLVNLVGKGLGFDQGLINEAMRGSAQVQRDIGRSFEIGVPSQAMTERIGKLQEAWGAFRQVLDQTANTVLDRVAPALTQLLDKVTHWIEANRDLVGKIMEFTAGFVTFMGVLTAARMGLALTGLAGMGTALRGIAGGAEAATIALGPFVAALALALPVLADAAGLMDIFNNGLFGSIPADERERLNKIQGKPEGYRAGTPVQDYDTGSPAGNRVRGIRNNNPLNLEYRPGQGAAATDGRFGAYASMEEGVAAAERQLLIYQDVHGLKTISEIVTRWAPPSENDTASYIRQVSQIMGVGANVPLDLHDETTAISLIRAMAKREVGSSLDEYTVRRGVRRGLGLGNLPPRGDPGPLGLPHALAPTSPVPSPRSRIPASSAGGSKAPPSDAVLSDPHTGTWSGDSGATSVTIGSINVHTQATDAHGIASDIGPAMRQAIITQANRGLS